jgi:hypothetical protein
MKQLERKVMIYSSQESTTRRMFCKRLAGIVVTGAFSGLEATATSNMLSKTEAMGNVEHLVSVCGTYCGACPMYINNKPGNEQKRKEMFERYAGRSMEMNFENLVCDGCLSGGNIAFHCQSCKMRLCASDKSDVARCSDCPDFPCSLMTDFSSDGKLHHAELLDNLRNLQKMGIKDWAKYEQERWTCPECYSPLSWYDASCSNCGAKRSERLFSLR